MQHNILSLTSIKFLLASQNEEPQKDNISQLQASEKSLIRKNQYKRKELVVTRLLSLGSL